VPSIRRGMLGRVASPNEQAETGPRRIVVVSTADRRGGQARRLASRLATTCHRSIDDVPLEAIALCLTEERIELRDPAEPKQGGVSVELTSGAAARRRGAAALREPLARAIGLRHGRPTVIDATVGLGRDAFLLAALGCRVVALERSPIVYALLADGLARAHHDSAAADVIDRRLTLMHADAIRRLPFIRAEVVYLDPMFPPRRRESAFVKKEMRMLRSAVGVDLDTDRLFRAAQIAATRRVVVKRPRHAPARWGSPTSVIEGRAMRFDIYPPAHDADPAGRS
jgi:16S rRNA (guanine1516-N2)-methyltransferase